MLLKSSNKSPRQVSGSDAPVTVFLLALFLFVMFTGMDLLAKALTKQQIATGTEIAMRYLASKPEDLTGARSIVQGYASTSMISETTVLLSTNLGYPSDPCVTTGSCPQQLHRSDGKYYFRDVFTVTAIATIPPFIPLPFLKTVTTQVNSSGTLEVYGCVSGSC
jgi:hypothetical protein